MQETQAIIIAGIFLLIIYFVIDYKTKNFIYEKQSIFISLIMMTILYLISFVYDYNDTGSYTNLINVAIVASILGGYIIFQKNKIYFFKGIDKKLVKEKRNEIMQIIDDYKSNYTDSKIDITLAGQKIVFENINKTQAEECLFLIGNFLDTNRREYSIKDYVIYYFRVNVLPVLVIFFVAHLILK